MDGAQTVEQLSVAELIPYAKNARTHDDAQVDAIARSIQRFGFNNPVLIDAKGEVIAGHGRLLAAAKLDMETVPVVRLEHLTEGQAKAYRLADNRLAELSGWDFSTLSEEVLDLRDEGFDPEELGWEAHELEVLLQADFSPAVTEDLPTKDEGSTNHSVAFSAEQWALVQPSVKAIKAKLGDGYSNAQALAQIAQEWLAGPGS